MLLLWMKFHHGCIKIKTNLFPKLWIVASTKINCYTMKTRQNLNVYSIKFLIHVCIPFFLIQINTNLDMYGNNNVPMVFNTQDFQCHMLWSFLMFNEWWLFVLFIIDYILVSTLELSHVAVNTFTIIGTAILPFLSLVILFTLVNTYSWNKKYNCLIVCCFNITFQTHEAFKYISSLLWWVMYLIITVQPR